MSHSEETDRAIFQFVFAAAMRDATNQRAFSGEKAWLTEDCDQFPESRDAIKQLVSDVIEGNFSEDSVPSYDDRFRDVCETVCKEINQQPKAEGKFCFGHAQKLINMAMKFFYLHSYGNEEKKERFRCCHCPMDGQMLNKVWSRKDDLKKTGIDLNEVKDFRGGWGKEDFLYDENGKPVFPTRYKAFQAAVRALSEEKHISPLEFDFLEWGRKNEKNTADPS